MEDFHAITSTCNLRVNEILDYVRSNEQHRSFKVVLIVCSLMTNKKQLITALALTAILVTGTFNLTPLAYSTGWNHDDDDDDHDDKIKICHIPPGNPDKAHTITISKAAWEAHKVHGDYKGKCNNDNHDNGEDCKCKKPSIFTVKYNGPGTLSGTGSNAPVTIEIYKKTDDIGKKPPLLTIPDIINDSPIVVNSNTFGKETLETNTIYRVMQNGVQIAIVSIHTSCSQPLFIGSTYRDSANIVTLTVESGTNSEGKQSIFLEHDPICEGVTLTVTKILEPPEDTGRFILQIDGVDKSAPVGNGETTGPILLMPGSHIVSESAATGTNLDDYTRTISGDCNSDGTIQLEKGDNAECIITNIKIKPATITLKKVITQDNTNEDQEVGEDAFQFSIKNTETNQVILITTENQAVPPGKYTLNEEGPDNFDFVLISGDNECPTVLEGMHEELDKFILNSGQHLTCVIFNDDDVDATPGGSLDGPGVIFHYATLSTIAQDVPEDDHCNEVGAERPCIQKLGVRYFIFPDFANDKSNNVLTETSLVLLTVLDTTDPVNTGSCIVTGVQVPSQSIVAICPTIGLIESDQFNFNWAIIETYG